MMEWLLLVAVVAFVAGATWIHPGLGVMTVAALAILVMGEFA